MGAQKMLALGRVLVGIASMLSVLAFGMVVVPQNDPLPDGIVPIHIEYGTPIKVREVVDGDTVVLENGATVRYIGIDTPETHHPTKQRQCYGEEAAAFNKKMVEGKMVTLQRDVSERDKYGRFLAYVYLEDDTFVEKELVQNGYAFAYKYYPDVAKSADLKAAQASAKSLGVGLWSACTVSKLSSGRYQTNAVQ